VVYKTDQMKGSSASSVAAFVRKSSRFRARIADDAVFVGRQQRRHIITLLHRQDGCGVESMRRYWADDFTTALSDDVRGGAGRREPGCAVARGKLSHSVIGLKLQGRVGLREKKKHEFSLRLAGAPRICEELHFSTTFTIFDFEPDSWNPGSTYATKFVQFH
jgi:hypothetical protein